MIRQRFYLKSFEDRREYKIAARDLLHNFEGDRNRKVISLEGAEVCVLAWYRIHGISKSTYHTYSLLYKDGVLLGTHGNKGVKRPRLRTVQVSGTIYDSHH